MLTMGIEKLKGSLLSEANEDAQKIVEAAQSHVKGMLEEERSKRSALKKDAEAEIAKLLEEQRNERIAWARLESKRIIAEAREDAIHEVLDAIFDALKDARKSPEYKKFLAKAVPQAASELGGDVVVHAMKGEKALIPAVRGSKVVDDLDCLGGAIVETADGKIRIDLTLETLFETRRDEIRKSVYDKLFGGK